MPGSDVAQLSCWAVVRRDAGFRPLHVFAHQDGRLAGGVLVLERRLPVIGRIGYVSSGPVVSAEVPRGPVVDRLGEAMHRLARSKQRLAGWTGRSGRAGRASPRPPSGTRCCGRRRAATTHTYDFGGISARAARILLDGRPDAATHLTGTEQFKASFGGEVYLNPEQVEFLASPLLRRGYDLSERTRAGGRCVEIATRALRGGRT